MPAPATTARADEAADAALEGPRAPLRSLALLHRLALAPEGCTLSELSAQVSTPKTSVLALLRALLHGGYVRLQGTRYFLGDESLMLATLMLAQRRPLDVKHLPEIAQPFLRSLAEKSGETVFVSALAPDGQEAIYIARAESSHPIRFMAEIGERRPLYSSAGGRTLLAFMPEPAREAYLKALKPTPMTPRTITDKKELRRMLERVRETGLSSTSDDTHVGVSAFGTPLRAQGGEVVAALVIAAPSERIAPQSRRMVELLQEHAVTISRALGNAGG